MTGRLVRFFAAILACLVSLAAANVTMAANLSTNHGGDKSQSDSASSTATTALPDPGNLTDYRDKVGQTFVFTVTGASDGSVYGDGVYTDDSQIATAAVHA